MFKSKIEKDMFNKLLIDIMDGEATAIVWDIDDVIYQEDMFEPDPNLSLKERKDVLALVQKKHDRMIGITYDTICQAITEILNRREE